jgi:hypothetical protein
LGSAASFFFGGAKEEARDFQRISDIETIKNALGLYFVDQGYYPEAITSGQSIVSPDGSTVYLAEVPTAPIVPNPAVDTEGYNYVRAASGTSYAIDYYLAGEAGGSGGSGGTASMVYSGNCTATPETSCEGQCIPSCSGKTCGDDGCGGSCGTCSEWASCIAGSCIVECNAGTFNGGAGISGNPYQICSCQQLQNIETNKSAYYLLVQNIDCSDTVNWNGGLGFAPISMNDNAGFSGNLDGAGYYVNSLYINRPTTTGVGLFARAASATITHLGVVNPNITGDMNTAGFAGMAWSSTISRSYVSGGSIHGGNQTGGFTGYANANAGSTYTDCYASTTVTGATTTGGFIAAISLSDVFIDCYATGSVTSNAQYLGGFAGASKNDPSAIQNSFSTTQVNSGTNHNGFIGYFSSYGAGSAGLSNVYWDKTNSTRTNCHSTDTNCTTINASSPNLSYWYSKSNGPMNTWDFDTIWQENADTYPTLR